MIRDFVAYYRVSTERQGASGLGLDAQRDTVTQYVRSVGGLLIDEFTEIESGKLRDRPVLLQSTARCRAAKATLVIARLDRLARNVAFVAALMEAGTDFVAVDAPYANRLMLHILAAFAEHEREQISARTKAALAAAKARGVVLGAHGSVLATDHKRKAEEFAESLRLPVEEAMRSGAATHAEIAATLNAWAVPTRETGRWHATTVARLLKRLGLRTTDGNRGERSVSPASDAPPITPCG
jgi:DNA invertase Pin-like site-specific DNA recombinase